MNVQVVLRILGNTLAVLNKGLSDVLNLSFTDVKFTTRPLFPVSKIQNSNWVSGFVEGKGNFMVMLKKNPSHKSGIQVALRFKVTQHNRDVEFMKSFVDFFGCGYCYIGEDCVDFVVTKFSDITDIILPFPFFSKYPLHGCKRLDFLDLLLVVEIMQSKAHITGQGLERIRTIKSGMNRGRCV